MTFLKKRVQFALILSLAFVVGCSLPTPWPAPFKFMAAKPFFFDKEGNEEEFVVTVAERRDHELALAADEEAFPAEVMEREPFRWEIRVSVWDKIGWAGYRLLERKILGKATDGATFRDYDEENGSAEYMKTISLGVLSSLRPISGRPKSYMIKVEVKKTDERFTSGDLPVRIGFRPVDLSPDFIP